MLCWTYYLLILSVIPLLTQCVSSYTPSTTAVTGPFDQRGNYVEAWVHRPDKWYRPSASSSSQHSSPPPISPKPIHQTHSNISPPLVTSVTRLAPPTSIPKVTTPKTIATPKKISTPKATSKPKPVALRYTVKKGDYLSRIASRHNVSTAALKKSNRISGDTIHPGQSLIIPR